MPTHYALVDTHETAGSPNFPAGRLGLVITQARNLALSGSTVLFGGHMLANAVAYLYHMLMARMLAPADYGIVVTLTSISYLLDVIMRTVQMSLTKTVAATCNSDVARAPAVFATAMRAVVPLAGVALIAQWLTSGWVRDFVHLESSAPLILLGLYMFSAFLWPVPRGILLGLNRLYGASAIVVLETAARLVVGLTLVASGLRVNGALTGYVAGNFLAFGIGLALLRRLLGPHTRQASRAASLQGLDRYALPVLVANMCLMVMAIADQITVTHFFSADVAGNYAVAFVLGRVIAMSAISLGTVVFTRSVAMHAEDRQHARLLAKGLLVMGSIALIATVAFLAAPALFVRLMAGSQYHAAPAYVGLVGIEMTLFGLVYIQVYYHLSIGKMQVIGPLCLAAALEITLLALHHATVQQVLAILVCVMGSLLACVSGLSWWLLRPKGAP